MKNIIAILLLTAGISANANFVPGMSSEQLVAEVTMYLSMDIPPSVIVEIAKKNKVDVIATLIDLGIDPTSALPAPAAGRPSTEIRNFDNSQQNFNVNSRASSFNSVGRGNSVSPS